MSSAARRGKPRTGIPLRVGIPLALLLLALAAGGFSLRYHTRTAMQQVEAHETEELARTMTRLQETLEYLLRTDNLPRVVEEVAALGADSELRHAFMLDEHGRVLASLRRAEIGAGFDEALRADAAADRRLCETLAERSRREGHGIIELTADGAAAVGVFPVVLGSERGELRPSRLGTLLIRQELAAAKARAQRAVSAHVAQFTLFMVALALLFAWWAHYAVTRRVGVLLNATRRFAAGDLGARTRLHGRDELSRIGQAFDHMAQGVARAHGLLRESETRLKKAQAIAHLGHWEWDIAAGTLAWSDEIYRIFGLQPGEFAATYEAFVERIHPDDREPLRVAVEAALRGEAAYAAEHRIVRPDGELRVVYEQAEVSRDAEGRPVYMVGTVLDVTERKRAEEALYAEKERALVTLHSIGDAVITTDAAGVVEYLNPVAEALTGWTCAEAGGRPLPEVFPIYDESSLEPVSNPVERCLREGRIVGLANHTVLLSREGARIAIEDSAAPIRDRSGRILGAILVFHDVSQTRELARQLSWQATHDALTGLANRHEFERHLRESLARTDRATDALLYLDLDQFKVVNDTCGHVAGDELLRQLSVVLRDQVRETDMLARLGGDEFGVLLKGCPLAQAEAIAHKLLQSVKEFRFVWQDRTFEVGASIGVVLIDDHAGDLGTVLSAADMACYTAKDLGRNRVHIYRRDDADLRQRHDEMHFVSRLAEALDEDRFVLHRQKIVPLQAAAGDVEHYEVLLRMLGPDGELVPPGAFIPAAERYGLMPAIDRWVIRTVFGRYGEQLRALHACAPACGGCRYAINLSGASLNDERFLEFVIEQLHVHRIPGSVICFEITETAAVANLARAVQFMRRLKELGCSFSLDDFGSGVSSFGYLKTLPVDYLKIDGSFVKDLVHDPIDRAMVAAINEIGHVMGIKTIAEFVEDETVCEQLRAMGVDFAQGYWIEAPTACEPVN